MIVSHERARALRADLLARGPATKDELSKRLGWPEAVVRGALRLLGDAGEADYSLRAGADGRPVKVWEAEDAGC